MTHLRKRKPSPSNPLIRINPIVSGARETMMRTCVGPSRSTAPDAVKRATHQSGQTRCQVRPTTTQQEQRKLSQHSTFRRRARNASVCQIMTRWGPYTPSNLSPSGHRCITKYHKSRRCSSIQLTNQSLPQKPDIWLSLIHI